MQNTQVFLHPIPLVANNIPMRCHQARQQGSSTFRLASYSNCHREEYGLCHWRSCIVIINKNQSSTSDLAESWTLNRTELILINPEFNQIAFIGWSALLVNWKQTTGGDGLWSESASHLCSTPIRSPLWKQPTNNQGMEKNLMLRNCDILATLCIQRVCVCNFVIRLNTSLICNSQWIINPPFPLGSHTNFINSQLLSCQILLDLTFRFLSLARIALSFSHEDPFPYLCHCSDFIPSCTR